MVPINPGILCVLLDKFLISLLFRGKNVVDLMFHRSRLLIEKRMVRSLYDETRISE